MRHCEQQTSTETDAVSALRLPHDKLPAGQIVSPNNQRGQQPQFSAPEQPSRPGSACYAATGRGQAQALPQRTQVFGNPTGRPGSASSTQSPRFAARPMDAGKYLS